MRDPRSCGSCVVQSCDAWQHLTLQELQRGAATSAAVGDLVLSVVVLARGRGVSTADDGDDASLRSFHHGVHETACAGLEGLHLENTDRTVPDHSLRLLDCRCVCLNGLGTAIQTHHVAWDATLHSGGGDLTILAKLGGGHEVAGQDDFDTLSLRLLHDLWDNLGAFLIEERGADLHIVDDLQEGVSHTSTDDHHVHLVKQVLDQLDLVADLGTTEDAQHRLAWCFQNLCESVQLLGHQEAAALDGEAITHH
mmetsp:Transcript_48630/g.115565  ORF Transcript_48630/g.115565 Transcript_48630/m.115565 type:complete len:252 (-) Transcript_48630:638-1393(-)